MPYGYGAPGMVDGGAVRNRITQALMNIQNPPPRSPMPGATPGMPGMTGGGMPGAMPGGAPGSMPPMSMQGRPSGLPPASLGGPAFQSMQSPVQQPATGQTQLY